MLHARSGHGGGRAVGVECTVWVFAVHTVMDYAVIKAYVVFLV